MLGIRCQRAVQTQHITLCQHLVQCPFLNIRRQLVDRLAGISHDRHVKSSGNHSYALTDIPKAHNTECLTCELRHRHIHITEIRTCRPLTFTILTGIVFRMIRNCQQVREYHLRHAQRTVGGHVRHDNAVLACCLQIHYVITRGQHTDIPQLWQLLYLLSLQQHLICQHHLCVLSPVDSFFRFCTLIHCQCTHFFQRFP